MLKYGESIQSLFPWDIPLWDSGYALFFGVFYIVLTTVGIGLGIVIYKTYKDMKNDNDEDKDLDVRH